MGWLQGLPRALPAHLSLSQLISCPQLISTKINHWIFTETSQLWYQELTAAETQPQLVNRQGNPWNPWGWMWDTAVHPSGEPYWRTQDLFVDWISQILLQLLFLSLSRFSLGPYFWPGCRDFMKWLPWNKSITGIGVSPGSSRISWYFTCFLLLGNFFYLLPVLNFMITASWHPVVIPAGLAKDHPLWESVGWSGYARSCI